MSWVVTFDEVIYGISRKSREDAMRDAARTLELGCGDPKMLIGDGDALRGAELPTGSGWGCHEATEKLLREVESVGGELSWSVVDGTADLAGGAA